MRAKKGQRKKEVKKGKIIRGKGEKWAISKLGIKLSAYLIALVCTLKPLPKKLFAVSVQGSGVPVGTAELKGTIEKGKALLIRGWGSVEGCPVSKVS